MKFPLRSTIQIGKYVAQQQRKGRRSRRLQREIADRVRLAQRDRRAATLAAHYERVGMRVGESSDARMYETRAARDMATRVVRDVFTPVERIAYGKRPADSPRP